MKHQGYGWAIKDLSNLTTEQMRAKLPLLTITIFMMIICRLEGQMITHEQLNFSEIRTLLRVSKAMNMELHSELIEKELNRLQSIKVGG